jgi:hypothetical protein
MNPDDTSPVDNALTDDSPCPIGNDWKGVPMKLVDTKFLHWCWHKFASSATGDTPQAKLGAYIRRSLPALKKENSDLIW